MSNIKNVKVDPTGFFLREDDTQSHASLDDSSSESSLEEYMPKKQDLVHIQTSPNVTVIKEGGSEPTTPPPIVEKLPVNPDTPIVQSGGIKQGDIENYLKIKEKDDDEESVNSTYSEKEMNSDELNTEKKEDSEPVVVPKPPPLDTPTDSQNDYYTDTEEEIVDMTENKFYEVLASVLEDEEGENVAENMAKLNRNLERHNELLELILKEFIKSNTHNQNSAKMIETLNNNVNNQTKILKSMNGNKNSNAIIEETEEISEIEPSEDDESQKGGKKTRRIERMKHRINTPDVKNIRVTK